MATTKITVTHPDGGTISTTTTSPPVPPVTTEKGLLTSAPSFAALCTHAGSIQAQHLRDLMGDSERCGSLTTEHNGLVLDYSRQKVTEETMGLLQQLFDEQGVAAKIAGMQAGEVLNTTEERSVLHTALRAAADASVVVGGTNVVPAVHEVLGRIKKFSERVRSGEWVGATGKPLSAVVTIGIGGSYLGPEFVAQALRFNAECHTAAEGRTLRFLANVDPADVAGALEGLEPETTLVVVVSKTFTTAETILNAKTVRQWIVSSLGEAAVGKHMAAVSTNLAGTKAFGIEDDNVFGFWDWVGGRYSVCSAVGVLPISLQYGFGACEKFLAGARDIDQHCASAPLRENIPCLLGALAVWNVSFLDIPVRAILPYSQALSRFAAHIQQVDMESNGKRVSAVGDVLPYAVGEFVFGEPGTNGQHSFYQLLHQGRPANCEFIGYIKSPTPMQVAGCVANHDELMSNFFAQPDALAFGKTEAQCREEGVPEELVAHKVFGGDRPSSQILINALTPFSLGQLLSIYENRTAVQGFLWGINSFDQWGVELGKSLAKKCRGTIHGARGGADAGEATLQEQGFNAATSKMMARFLA